MKPETKGLLARATDDARVLSIDELPDVIFGGHAEAAIEKYFKALLNEITGGFPYTHDLKLLASLLTASGETVPMVTLSFALLTKYASHYRYDDMETVLPLDRISCCHAVKTIGEYVNSRIAHLSSSQ